MFCRENNTGHHMGCSVGIPSGYVNIAIENGTFIVDLAIKDGDFLQLCKPLLEGTYHRFTPNTRKRTSNDDLTTLDKSEIPRRVRLLLITYISNISINIYIYILVPHNQQTNIYMYIVYKITLNAC